MIKKVCLIENIKTGEKQWIHSKREFCKEKGLHVRLLDMTFTGERHTTGGYKQTRRERVMLVDHPLVHSDDRLKEKVYISDLEMWGLVVGSEQCVIDDTHDDRVPKVEEEIEESELLRKANKKIQDLTDKLRIARKSNRLEYRQENIEDYFQNTVVSLLKKNGVKKHKTPLAYEYENNRGVTNLIVQLSDLHIGKKVVLPNNKFDYKVAQQRLRAYYYKLVDEINSQDLRDVTVVFTGDLFNLDSHFDSLLTNEDNRAESFVQGLDMIRDFIESLWTHVHTLKIVGVVGNESRVRTTEYNSNVDKLAKNNLDTLLFAILKRVLPDDIEFLNNCDGLVEVFPIDRYNIAICHGDKLKKHTDEEINKFKLRMYETYGTIVDYVLLGHIHSTMITSHWGRSGSLVGTDPYYANGLNGVGGIATQNIYYVTENGIEGREIKL